MANPGFFERQAHARRNTGLLIFLFLTAVTLITLAVCLVGYLVTRSQSSALPFHHWLMSGHGLTTAAAVVLLIGTGSLVRWADLAGGGSRVAKMVGARLIEPDTSDSEERTLRNIVEEMAIASGVSVPNLYVMDNETSINAFVAGYTPGEAVMVVTHGALTHLTRDELQGVVAHEFSHILNGDMRINVRLIALLAGILMLGQIGHFMIRVGFYSSARSRNRDGRAQAAMGLIGLALLIIGYVGVFFGRLIQSAVSRQREMLADASSVQFTRNPEGIGGALFKIGMKGGYLDTTSHASDMNHMCFGESARMKFSSLLASHPPIDQRINAIQPGMLARLRSRLRDTEPGQNLRQRTPPQAPGRSGLGDLVNHMVEPARGRGRGGTSPVRSALAAETPQQPTKLSSRVGTVNPQSEAFAIDLLNQLPATFRSLLYTRAGAIQVCYGLLIFDLSRNVQKERLQLVPAHPLLGAQQDLLDKMLPALVRLGEAARFPILELAMPALRKLDPEERDALLDNIQKLVAADNRVSLFELALTTFLDRHLNVDAERVVPVKYRNYRQVLPAIRRLLSLFARAGTDSAEEADKLYLDAMAGFGNGSEESRSQKVSMRELREALEILNRLSPLLKPAVIDACGYCVTHDGRVDVREYELMRLVADQLDCPMPPL